MNTKPKAIRRASAALAVLSLLISAAAHATPATTNVSAGELAGMQMLYAVDNDVFDFNDAYTVDNSAGVAPGSFARVAYYVELGDGTPSGTFWVWASMDTFNASASLVGVPRAGTGIVENGTLVSNLNVETNHPNVTPGTFSDGIIEFWASSYNPNGGGLFGSNDTLFDWKDSGGSTGGGHGSFQIFAFPGAPAAGNAQTLFGITANGGSGIGDQPTGHPDWTFGPGTGTYTIRNLEIWVSEPPARLTVADASVAEGDVGTTPLVFDVTLSKAVDAPFTVDYTITERTATLADGDFSGALTGTLNFAGTAGEVQPISIDVIGDTKVELDETVSVELSNLQLGGSDPVEGVGGPPLGGSVSVFTNVPEAADFTLVYELPIPNAGNFRDATPVPYATDNTAAIDVPFDRIAYYMELDDGSGPRWVYASMDAFTADVGQIGLPHNIDNPVIFQQIVDNMNVASNVPGIVTGTGIATGNIEFWSTNYNETNAIGIPGANPGSFDFGDGGAGIGAGYGSFQVHNHGAAQTLFAYDQWGTGGTDDLGIGSQPSGNPDWTFAGNAGGYTIKNLQILVRPTGVIGTIVNDDSAKLIIADANTAEGDSGTQQLVFDVTLDTAVDVPVTVDFGTEDGTATTADNDYLGQTGNLSFSGAAGQTLQISVDVNGDCDPEADEQLKVALSNLQAGDRSVAIEGTSGGGGPESVFTNVSEASSYSLVYDLPIPNSAGFRDASSVPYATDNTGSITGAFDRIAYYLELDTGSGLRWVYASMDAFTSDVGQIGLPHNIDNPVIFQQIVDNMNVDSNVPGIVTGTGIATGNIEFFSTNYNQSNAIGIPGADPSRWDFGDGGAGIGTGHASFQIHNHGAAQTLFGYSDWGGNSPTSNSELGIGTNTGTVFTPGGPVSVGGEPDWTFADSTNLYAVKNLQILVRAASNSASGAILNDDFAPEVTPPGIDDLTIVTSSPQDTVELFPHFQDFDDADNTLTYTVTGNTNPTLIQTDPISSGDGILTINTPCTLIGTADITVEAKDPCGLTVTDTFTVEVKDDVAPEVTTPGLVKVLAPAGQSSAVVNFTVTGNDKVDGTNVIISCTPPSGSTFNWGATVVNCTATDLSGNVSTTGSFAVVVKLPDDVMLESVSVGGAADGAGGVGDGTYNRIDGAHLTANGKLLVAAEVDLNKGLWSGDIGGLDLVGMAPITLPPGGGGEALLAFDRYAVGENGDSGFRARLDGGGEGHWASSGGTLSEVAVIGGAVPDVSGTTFYKLPEQGWAVTNSGEYFFLGQMDKADAGINEANNQGIFSDAGGLLIREGSLATSIGGGATYTNFEQQISANDAGQVAFASALRLGTVVSGVDNRAVFCGDPSSPSVVARRGDAAPGAGGAEFDSFLDVGLNAAGECVLFSRLRGAVTPDDDTGLWSDAGGGGLALVAREGAEAPGFGAATTVYDSFSDAQITDSGAVVFRAEVRDTAVPLSANENEAIYVWTPGVGVALVAREGGDAPETSGVYTSLPELSVHRGGELGFNGVLRRGVGGVTRRTQHGVWVHDLANAGSDPVLLVQAGDPITVGGEEETVTRPSITGAKDGGTAGRSSAVACGNVAVVVTYDRNRATTVFVMGVPDPMLEP